MIVLIFHFHGVCACWSIFVSDFSEGHILLMKFQTTFVEFFFKIKFQNWCAFLTSSVPISVNELDAFNKSRKFHLNLSILFALCFIHIWLSFFYSNKIQEQKSSWVSINNIAFHHSFHSSKFQYVKIHSMLCDYCILFKMNKKWMTFHLKFYGMFKHTT